MTRERVRFVRKLSADYLAGVRAGYEDASGAAAGLIVQLVDELAHAYEAILAPGYGFEAEMDRFRTYLEMGESMAEELRHTKDLYEASAMTADALAEEKAALKRELAQAKERLEKISVAARRYLSASDAMPESLVMKEGERYVQAARAFLEAEARLRAVLLGEGE